MKTSLLGLTPEKISEKIKTDKKFRAKQIYKAIYSGVRNFDSMTDIPLETRALLNEKFTVRTSAPDLIIEDENGNKKMRLKFADSLCAESVLLNDGKGRETICISSQCGCRQGCRFCRTADMGFLRDLTAGEILEQFLEMGHIAGKISNIVFMGMGEPFDNSKNLFDAIEILNDKNGIGIGARKITISTCGIVPGIMKLAEYGHEIKLAVSLNSAIEKKRKEIMPVTNIYPLAELKKALLYFQEKKNKRITLEYVLLDKFNNSEEDADALKEFISGLSALVNIIPWNRVEGKPFAPPDKRSVDEFRLFLKKRGILHTLRIRKGFGISGACGQLAYKNF